MLARERTDIFTSFGEHARWRAVPALLDRVQIGAVGRQIDELRLSGDDRLGDAGGFVAAQIVEQDNGAGRQCSIVRRRGGVAAVVSASSEVGVAPVLWTV